MVYCNSQQTNYQRNLACTHYTHYSVISKKNFPDPEKVQNEEPGLFTPCWQSFCHSPHPKHPDCCGCLNRCLALPLSTGNGTIPLWLLPRSLGIGFGQSSGNWSQSRRSMEDWLWCLMIISIPRQERKFLAAPRSLITRPSRINRNILGRRISWRSAYSK